MEQEHPSVNLEDESSLSPAIMTGIMVSIGIGLFTICAVFLWLCKARLGKSEKVEDKCVLVEDDSKEHNDSHLKDSSLHTATGSVNKCGKATGTCGETTGTCGEKNPERDEGKDSIKEAASIELTEGLGVVRDCENLKSKLQDKELDTELGTDQQAMVQLGPNFNGNINISCDTQTDQHTTNVRPELPMLCDSTNEPCNQNQSEVILQETWPEYKKSINSITSENSTTSSLDSTSDIVGKNGETIMSPSLKHLMIINQPIIDRQLSSSNDEHDTFMFPQDNFVATRSSLEAEEVIQLPPTATAREFTRPTTKKGVEISRSLDSQQRSLDKGCQLLLTRPRRSSFRMTPSDSDGCLKKYVHFPEDIRNIRKVYKYESFDDGMLLHNYANGETKDKE